MKLSLSTLPFIEQELDIHLFEFLKRNGINSIELFAQRPHCDFGSQRHIDLIEMVERELSININSIHMPIYFNRAADVRDRKKINISSLDSNIRMSSVKEVIRHIEVAGRLCIPIVILHTGIENNSEKESSNLLESLYLISEVAVKNDILVGLENHTTEFVSIDVLVSLIQKIDSQNIGICLDIGHSNIFSNYMRDLHESRRYLFSLHLHDNNGGEDEHLFPYEGVIDFDYIMGFLRTSKFQGVVTLELNGENIADERDLIDFIKKASNYLHIFSNPRLSYSNILEPT
ncbi:MAG: sugar phosphate isomerase/epimerase [Deltaproteobacteria bacterium]|nr:sugar phosphate isomerase/epimerase [Deltaproteobacteria bacterium]